MGRYSETNKRSLLRDARRRELVSLTDMALVRTVEAEARRALLVADRAALIEAAVELRWPRLNSPTKRTGCAA